MMIKTRFKAASFLEVWVDAWNSSTTGGGLNFLNFNLKYLG